jgi:hypothetical protein
MGNDLLSVAAAVLGSVVAGAGVVGGRGPESVQHLHQLNVHCPTWEKNGLIFYLPMFTILFTRV